MPSRRPMMRDLRMPKTVLHRIVLHIRKEWIPSAANRFSGASSRIFPRGNLQIWRHVRRSIMDGMNAADVFPLRPLVEHSGFMVRVAFEGLRQYISLLSPPVYLIYPTLQNHRMTKAAAFFLIQYWPGMMWYSVSLELASRMRNLKTHPGHIWAAARNLHTQWQMLCLEVTM